jgi:hypothetical protein
MSLILSKFLVDAPRLVVGAFHPLATPLARGLLSTIFLLAVTFTSLVFKRPGKFRPSESPAVSYDKEYLRHLFFFLFCSFLSFHFIFFLHAQL